MHGVQVLQNPQRPEIEATRLQMLYSGYDVSFC